MEVPHLHLLCHALSRGWCESGEAGEKTYCLGFLSLDFPCCLFVHYNNIKLNEIMTTKSLPYKCAIISSCGCIFLNHYQLVFIGSVPSNSPSLPVLAHSLSLSLRLWCNSSAQEKYKIKIHLAFHLPSLRRTQRPLEVAKQKRTRREV